MNYKFNFKTDEIYQPIKEIISDKDSKKYFILLLVLYLVGYASIIRADVDYIDDLGTYLYGIADWNWTSRYLSDVFSKFIYIGSVVTNISPLSILLAVVVLSLSSLFLIKIINSRLSFTAMLGSVCIGLFPYFLQNISYSGCTQMALSVLFGIYPFLYYKSSKRIFYFFSAIGILCTLLTYQLASGVYLILFTALITKDFLQNKITYKEGAWLTVKIFLIYIGTLLLYRYVFVAKVDFGYVSASVFSFSELPTGVYHNLLRYFSLMKNDLYGSFIGYALPFLCVLYIVKLLLLSTQNKIKSFIVSSVSLMIMALFLWGG